MFIFKLKQSSKPFRFDSLLSLTKYNKSKKRRKKIGRNKQTHWRKRHWQTNNSLQLQLEFGHFHLQPIHPIETAIENVQRQVNFQTGKVLVTGLDFDVLWMKIL